MELAECLRQAGIVGCGGAGSPAYAKYAGKEIDTIIINGAECEPLLQTDKFIMRNYSSRLIKAADWLTQKSGAGKCVIALKSSYKREIDSLAQAIRENESQVSLHTLDSFFPAGDEQSIVYEVTGKVVPPASIPLSVGCVVSNAATLLCIADAMEGRAYTKKYLTITGEVKEPVIARVPIGTPVNRCLEMAGGLYCNKRRAYDGEDSHQAGGPKGICEQNYVGLDCTSGKFSPWAEKGNIHLANGKPGKIRLYSMQFLYADVSQTPSWTSY